MPPRSYLVTAAVLVALFAVSLPLTMGFAVIGWYWLFAAVACVLVVGGAVRIVHGLGAPAWIGIALASPGVLWAAGSLLNITSYRPTSVLWIMAVSTVTNLAFPAAAAGALRLMEILSRPHVVFRIGYAVLAISVAVSVVSLINYFTGWSFTKNLFHAAYVRPLYFAVTLVQYGAFIGAPVMIAVRFDLERWIAVVIGLIGVFVVYETMRTMFATGFPGDTMFWLWPVFLLIGGAAVWRIGSLLHRQAAMQRIRAELARQESATPS